MSIKRESVDFDPLASFLSTPPPPPPPAAVVTNVHSTPSSERSDRRSNSAISLPPQPRTSSSSSDNGTVIPPQHTLEAPYLCEQFLAECRLMPLEPNIIPDNVSGMQMCAKVRAWKNVIVISSRVLQGTSGLELVLKNNNTSDRRYVLSSALQLRLEGLFRLKLFDELVEEINTTLTSLSPSDVASGNALADNVLGNVSTRESTGSAGGVPISKFHNIQLGILKNANYRATLALTDFNTQMTLNMLMLEVRLLTGRAEEAIEELFQLKKQLHVDISIDLSDSLDDSAMCALLEKYYWYWGVSVSVCNAVCRQRQWKLAISELSGMICELVDLRAMLTSIRSNSVAGALSESNVTVFSRLMDGFISAEATLRCRLARLLLQIGAVQAGCQCVALAILLLKSSADTDTDADSGTLIFSDTLQLSDEQAMGVIDEFADSDVLNSAASTAKQLSVNSLTMHTAMCVGLIYYCRGEYSKASGCFELVMQVEGMLTEVSLTSTHASDSADLFGALAAPQSNSILPALTASLELDTTATSANSTGSSSYISLALQRKLSLFEVVSHAICNKPNRNVLLHEIEYANSTNESIVACATNNYAICALHLKQIGKAVSNLERLIKDNPTVYLIDPVVFNLCTMYDLTCAPEVSVQRKKALQAVAQAFFIEDPMLHWRCFRLSSSS